MIQNKTQVETVNFRLFSKSSSDRMKYNTLQHMHIYTTKIYSLNLRLVLNHMLNPQDVLSFRNLFFTHIFLNCWLVMAFGCKIVETLVYLLSLQWKC
jgi:hypothetical protein